LVQRFLRVYASPMDLLAQLSPCVIGASRRPLTTTFGNDLVEHAKVMKFFK
jgi:hypothetical protein